MMKFISFLVIMIFVFKLGAQTANTSPLPAGETIIGSHLHVGAGNEVWTDANDLYFNYRGTASATHFWNLAGGSGKSIMTLLSNGNVGIGISLPTEKLQIDGRLRVVNTQIYDNEINRYNNDNLYIGYRNTANTILQANGGNVGIGTVYPKGKLHISGGDLILQNESNGYPILWLKDVTGNKSIRLDYNSLISQGDPLYLRSSNIILNDQSGNVLIGKTSQTATGTRYKLDVEGLIRANEIVVNTTGADFVFEPTYKLRTLSELESFIRTNKHLPDIAPAKEMQENGVNAGEMQAKLLQKVEELTLYVIEQEKKNAELQNQLNAQKEEIKQLKQLIK